jgi:hypothetical protein
MRGMKYNLTIIKPDNKKEIHPEVDRNYIMEVVGKRLKELYNLDYVLTRNHFVSLQMGYGGKFLKDLVKLQKIPPEKPSEDAEMRRQYHREYYRKRQEKLAKSANADLLTT